MSKFDQQEDYFTANVYNTDTVRRSQRLKVPSSKNQDAILQPKKTARIPIDSQQPSQYLNCLLPNRSHSIQIEIVLLQPQPLPVHKKIIQKKDDFLSRLLQTAVGALQEQKHSYKTQIKPRKMTKANKQGHINKAELNQQCLAIDHSVFGKVVFPFSNKYCQRKIQPIQINSQLLEGLQAQGQQRRNVNVQLNFLKNKFDQAKKKFKPQIQVQ